MSNQTFHQQKKRGLVVVFTGNGKGKTSAAMGIMTRASGQGMRVGVIQFIKSPDRIYGEALAAQKLDVKFISMGEGFVFNQDDKEASRQAALRAWESAKASIKNPEYDVLILDEITYLFYYEWIDVKEAVEWIKSNKPAELHLVMTGRYAPAELIEYADMVTEMNLIRHPLKEQGIPAQQGIDY